MARQQRESVLLKKPGMQREEKEQQCTHSVATATVDWTGSFGIEVTCESYSHYIYSMYVVIFSTYDVSCATCLLSIHINRLECGLRHRNWTPMMLLCCLLSMFDSLLVSLRLSRRTWPDEFVRIKSDGYWYFHLFLQDVCFQLVNTKKKQTTVLIEAAHRSIVDMAMWPQMIWNTLPMTMNIILVCEVRRPHGSVDLKFTINCNQFITSAAIGIVRLQAGYTTYSTIMHIELAIGNDGPAIN